MTQDLAFTASVARLSASYFKANKVAQADVPSIIAMFAANLGGAASAPAKPIVVQEPAVAIRASVKPDYLICLEDGARMKSLKRYLMRKFNLTPNQYRAKWNLPADYPMVSPNYSQQRSDLAKSLGLGRKGKGQVATETVQESGPEAAAVTENPDLATFGSALNGGLTGEAPVTEFLVQETEPKTEPQPKPELTEAAPIPAAAEANDSFDDAHDHNHSGDGADLVKAHGGKLPEGYASVSDTFVQKDGVFAIICLIDQKPIRDLGRHTRKHHKASAAQYREAFGLPVNYPMTADQVPAFLETLKA